MYSRFTVSFLYAEAHFIIKQRPDRWWGTSSPIRTGSQLSLRLLPWDSWHFLCLCSCISIDYSSWRGSAASEDCWVVAEMAPSVEGCPNKAVPIVPQSFACNGCRCNRVTNTGTWIRMNAEFAVMVTIILAVDVARWRSDTVKKEELSRHRMGAP